MNCIEDEDFTSKQEENFIYQVKGTKSTFNLFSEQAICIATAASAFQWSFQDSTQYWEQTIINNSLFGNKVYRCKGVFWFNPTFTIEKIPVGIYHLYLRHGNNNPYAECKFFRHFGIGNEDQFGTSDPFSDYIPFENHQGRLMNTYAGTIDLSEKYDQLVNIKIEIFSSNYVSDYLFEGGILVPTFDLDSPPPFFFELQKDKDLVLDLNRKANAIVLLKPNKIQSQEQESEEEDDNKFTEKDIENLSIEEKQKHEKLLAIFEEIWTKYDTNNNHYLDYDEFLRYINDIFDDLNIPYSSDRADDFFNRSDTQKNGKLKKQNIVWLVSQIINLQEQQEEESESKESENQENETQEVSQIDQDQIQNFLDRQLTLEGEVTGQTEGNQHESAENLISHDEYGSSKWCMTGSSEGSVFIELEDEIKFTAFGIKSANDCPHRDPIIVELFIKKSESDQYESIYRVDELDFNSRFQTKSFEISEEAYETKSIRVDFESGSNELQVAEILFYK